MKVFLLVAGAICFCLGFITAIILSASTLDDEYNEHYKEEKQWLLLQL